MSRVKELFVVFLGLSILLAMFIHVSKTPIYVQDPVTQCRYVKFFLEPLEPLERGDGYQSGCLRSSADD